MSGNMLDMFSTISEFNDSKAFNKACKLLYCFMTALAVGMFLARLRGAAI
jgi:hypothetical protein